MLAGNCFELALEPLSRFRAGSGWPWNLHGISSHPEAPGGTFLGPSGGGVLRAGFPASRGETLPVVLLRAVPGAPVPPPPLLTRSGGRIKGLAALIGPHGLPPAGGFHGKRKGRWGDFPKGA